MPKPLGKHSKAVGGIIAILLIIGAVIIAFALIEFGLSAQQRQAEIQQKTYEAQAKAADIVKSVNSVWFFDESTSTLTINVTNNYAEPITVTGITVLYESGTYEILKDDLSKTLGTRFIKGQTLPYTLMPGETLSIVYETLGGAKPATVRVAIVTYQVVVASSAKQYFPTNVTAAPTPTYKVILAPTMFGEGTVTTKGYDLEPHQIPPSDITTNKGTPDPGGNIAHISNPNDGLAYNVTSIKEERTDWLTGWNYRRPITITNTLAQTLTDYQVRIELDPTYAEIFENANPDGSDIRFTLSDGVTKIPYWIQKWDSVNKEAIIWVKVSIPANGETTIYMYYGNPTAASESNGDAVFELFEDFEDGAPTWTINNGFGSGNGLWHITNAIGASYIGNSLYFGDDITLTYDNTGSTREGVVDAPQFILNSGYGYELLFYSKWEIESPSDYSIIDFWRIFSNYDILTVEINGVSVWEKDSNTNPTSNGQWLLQQINITEYAGQPVLIRFHFDTRDGKYNDHFGWAIDNVIIRKIVSPEPSLTIGSKESILHITQVEVKFSNVPSNTKKLDFTIRLKFNVSNVDVELYLWNGSSWDRIKNTTVDTAYSEVLFSTSAVGRYVVDGIVSLSINVTHSVPFKEFIDYVGLRVYTPTRTVIYIGVGGNNSIYKYILDTGQFDSEVIKAKYGDVPIVFNGNVSMDYDSRNLLWVVSDSSLYYYNITEKQWYLYANLLEPVGEGCSLIYLNNKTYIFIGGGSSRLYVYDVRDLSAPNPQYSSYDLGFSVSAYSVAESDGRYIYVLAGGGDVGFYRIDPLNPEEPLSLNDSPTAYAVGLAYDEDRDLLWLIGRGGGIYYYDIVNNVWKPYQQQIPYTPQSQGNRLEYYNGKLYHVRDDYTRELWIIDVSK